MTAATEIQPDRTVRETAQILACTPKHVYVLIREGALHSYKLGRITRVAHDSIEHLRQHGYDRQNPAA